MEQTISDSHFHMWRAIVAMMHADGVVTPQELSFINDYIGDVQFSSEQSELIAQDISTPQLVHDMFSRISDEDDRKNFFALARALSWCDGNFDEQEKTIIEHLEKSDLMSENQHLLEESRDVVNEVELCEDQWRFKTERSRNLFGFLNGIMRQAS